MPHTRVLIIGSGFSGLAMAAGLRTRGIEDFVILERAGALGGTWRDNTYPGCACDVRSALYSFSFAPNPEWSRQFAPQAEIQDYLHRTARERDLLRHLRTDTEVTAAAWDDASRCWRIDAAGEAWTADALVVATGPLSEPAMPAIPGLDAFAGPVFHSARWRHEVPLAGRRVAVIGTGASAVQFVPRLQPEVAQLDLYQRTPAWIVPRLDRAVPAWRRALYRRVPLAPRLVRGALFWVHEALFAPFRHRGARAVVQAVARWHLERQVPDPSLRAALTPAYDIGCKRVILSDDYYPALTRPNVSLVTDPIVEVVPEGVRTARGVRPADVLVLGTGFRATDPPIAARLRGRDGRTLAEHWAGSPVAHRATTVHGFPNLFLMLGPNAGLGHSSVVLMAEAQVRHAIAVLDLAEARGVPALEPRRSAQDAWVRWVDAALAPTVWNRGGCRSWYLDRTGRNATLWPYGVPRFQRMVEGTQAEDYASV